jgi:hypothetical protein
LSPSGRLPPAPIRHHPAGRHRPRLPGGCPSFATTASPPFSSCEKEDGFLTYLLPPSADLLFVVADFRLDWPFSWLTSFLQLFIFMFNLISRLAFLVQIVEPLFGSYERMQDQCP